MNVEENLLKQIKSRVDQLLERAEALTVRIQRQEKETQKLKRKFQAMENQIDHKADKGKNR